MKRVAVLGIDGSGKSTVLQALAGPGVSTFTCPEYHATPDTPLADLSRALNSLSRLADSLGSFELKATAMYLQMTLYGPVERFFADVIRPALLASEHHPIIDSLAYAPLYVGMVKRDPDRGALEPRVRERLGPAFDAVLRWSDRLELGVDFWRIATQVTALFTKPAPELLRELVRRYGTVLPDVAVFLDVPAETAVARLDARADVGRELHESTAALGALRRATVATLARLEELAPAMAVFTIDTSRPRGEVLAEARRAIMP